MNNEKQRIAIAEACGWKTTSDSPNWTYYRPDGRGWNGSLPDYLNDLNAMHEAESILDANQRVKYASLITRQFIDEIYQVIPNNLNFPICFPAINVKAEVKAENFLRAIGKWEDEA